MPHPLSQQSHPENACNEICPKSRTSGRRSKRLRGAQGQVPYNAPWAELKGKGFLCPSLPAGQGGQEVSVRGKAQLLHPQMQQPPPGKSKIPPQKLALFLMARVQLGARWHDSACLNREKRKSTSANIHTSEVRGQHKHLWHYCYWLRVFAYECGWHRDKRFSRSKLDSCQTFCLLIKMTDARTGMADQIQTLTQLTAICSQCYYSKWHYGGMCGCKTCWCAAGGVCVRVQVLMSELGAAAFNIEWVYRPNGNSGSWLRQMVLRPDVSTGREKESKIWTHSM